MEEPSDEKEPISEEPTVENPSEDEQKNVEETQTIEEVVYEYLEGANQTITVGEEGASFRIDADYSLFENGGKVYIDDILVSSDNYTSKSGSTIISFTKDYMSSLRDLDSNTSDKDNFSNC